MKITEVNIPENYNRMGLEKVHMSRLGNMILIAGKNGSGKSRLLKTMKDCAWLKEDSFLAYETKKDLDWAISQGRDEEHIIKLKEKLGEIEYIKYDVPNVKPQIVDFVPKKTELEAANYGIETLESYHDTCMSLGMKNVENSVLAYIQFELTRYLNATHPQLKTDNRIEIIESFESLNKLINIFLGDKITANNNGLAMLFGFEISQAKLSEGQKILLQLCIALHAQKVNLNQAILFLDEPENHLHADVLINIIEKIREVLLDGQIWISTHSIELLSYYNNSNLWFMDNNKIEYSGRMPERVLRSLIGNEIREKKLQEFINFPEELASNQFAYECLYGPNAVLTGQEDKQTNQINDILNSKAKFNQLRVLDYGAGKGRLAEAIYYHKSKDKMYIDYIAFDEYDTDKITCENAIAKLYGNAEGRYFNDIINIHEKYDENSFDIIILCNVLHEIEINKWPSLFRRKGILDKLLSENGSVLIVEDLLIPKGEKPNQKGFILLGVTEIKKLFDIKEGDTGFVDFVADKDNRLHAYLIPKEYLYRISTESINNALEYLKEHAKREIIRLREYTDYKSGRLHGMWSQLLVNVILHLEERM